MTTKELKQKIRCDEITKYNGIFTCRKGFFYRMGKNAMSFKQDIEQQLLKSGILFSIIDFGEKYTNFIGGADLKNQSHWFVKVEIY